MARADPCALAKAPVLRMSCMHRDDGIEDGQRASVRYPGAGAGAYQFAFCGGLMELLCPRDLALRLGAIEPANIVHHRELKAHGMLIRDERAQPLFWLWVDGAKATQGSSL